VCVVNNHDCGHKGVHAGSLVGMRANDQHPADCLGALLKLATLAL
ncbi:MAG: hypothetical protein RJA60_624, partial [Actinomycetota bacterium]